MHTISPRTKILEANIETETKKWWTDLFEFGLNLYWRFAVFRSSIVYKSSGEHLRTAITIDSKENDQKPGRRNVRNCILWWYFSNFVIFTGFETILNKVIAAYVVLSLPGWSTIFGDICLWRHFPLKLKTQLYTMCGNILNWTLWGPKDDKAYSWSGALV